MRGWPLGRHKVDMAVAMLELWWTDPRLLGGCGTVFNVRVCRGPQGSAIGKQRLVVPGSDLMMAPSTTPHIYKEIKLLNIFI